MISVVIPVRNREAIVGRTLDSIVAQTRAADQIILVDNGSTDGSLRVMREFAAARPNVTVLCEPRPGAAEARNCGLGAVTEEYVAFFDSDDTMAPRHLEQICSELVRLGRPEIGAFGMERVGLDGSVIRKPFRSGDPMFNHIFHAILSTQRYVVRTEFIRSAGGWAEQTPVWDDYLLGIMLLARGPRVEELKLDAPVRMYAQLESITGVDFASKAGQWESVLDRCEDFLRCSGMESYASLIDYRRAILAGEYRKEGRPELVGNLTSTPLMRLLARYVAMGGRGVADIAALVRHFCLRR
ncbi:MAG: glycosyltransferase family 2 protein [Muribaculaceae bacterium]|nr:glycosyltransferase family 2 protein [Muribaculaceae bacterium]